MSAPPAYGWKRGQQSSSGHYLHDRVVVPLRAAGAVDVLDAGCGHGALAMRLAEEGFRVVGVDGDAAGIAVARADHPEIRFEQILFGDDPGTLAATPDGRFDAVVSTEVIEHLYAPHELARFAYGALRPGGLLVITTPYHGYLKNLVLAVAGKWDGHVNPLWHGGHIKFWSVHTLTRLLEQAGFTVTGTVGAGRVPYLWKSMVMTARRPA